VAAQLCASAQRRIFVYKKIVRISVLLAALAVVSSSAIASPRGIDPGDGGVIGRIVRVVKHVLRTFDDVVIPKP
jgi:hypothetical protein